MGIAPSAACIAVLASLFLRILLLTAAVTFWGAGFDVLYACQDFDFDQQAGLHSIPRYFGIRKSLWISRCFHLIMILLLISLVGVFGLGKSAIAGVAVVALLLTYEHSLVSPRDLSKLNAAFFTMNGVISVAFFFLSPEIYCCVGDALNPYPVIPNEVRYPRVPALPAPFQGSATPSSSSFL